MQVYQWSRAIIHLRILLSIRKRILRCSNWRHRLFRPDSKTDSILSAIRLNTMTLEQWKETTIIFSVRSECKCHLLHEINELKLKIDSPFVMVYDLFSVTYYQNRRSMRIDMQFS